MIVESILYWTPSRILEAKQRLRALNQADDARKAKEAALNELEAYIYRTKNYFADEEEKLNTISTTEQRDAVLVMCNELEEWLYEDGRFAALSDYRSKLAKLRNPAEAILKRLKESVDRPTAVSKAKKLLGKVRQQVTNEWAIKMPQITVNETEKMVEVLVRAEQWLADQETAQDQKTPFEDPVFLAEDVLTQIKPVSTMFDRLKKKPKPKPEVILKNATSANSTDGANGQTEAPAADATGESDAPASEEPSVGEDNTAGEDTEASGDFSGGSDSIPDDEL